MACLRLLAALAPAVLLAGSGAGSSSTTGNNAAPSQIQQAALQQLSLLRSEAQLPHVDLSQALEVAATRHAGYEVLKFGTAVALTHYETVDGTATGAADTGNALFTAVLFPDRIRLEHGGTDLFPTSSVTYFEGLTSAAGPSTVAALWNSVYHRLPLCRHATRLMGFGDAEQARNQYPAAALPPAITGYGTLELAGDLATTITASWWPVNLLTNMPLSFSSDSEVPDPIGLQMPGGTPNPYQSPQAASTDVDMVGPPMHVIIPNSQDWGPVSMILNAQGSSIQLPAFVVAGFGQTGTLNAPVFPATLPSGVTCFDANLNPGELMIVPQQPLLGSTTYLWRLQAATAGSGSQVIDTQLISFTTAP